MCTFDYNCLKTLNQSHISERDRERGGRKERDRWGERGRATERILTNFMTTAFIICRNGDATQTVWLDTPGCGGSTNCLSNCKNCPTFETSACTVNSVVGVTCSKYSNIIMCCYHSESCDYLL